MEIAFFMPTLTDILKNVNDLVNDFDSAEPKRKYSEPKIYTGGIDVSKWNKLSKKSKDKALSKYWCVYYSYRNPETGKLVRQSNLKGGVNYYKTKDERMQVLRSIRKSLLEILKSGYSPYNKSEENTRTKTIQDAFRIALSIKKKEVKETTYKDYSSRITHFSEYLSKNGFLNISQINKTIVSKFLNKFNSKNSNNFRAALSSIFSVLSERSIIKHNFIKELRTKKTTETAITLYTEEQINKIEKLLVDQNPTLLHYIDLFSYMFWRPIEIVRLEIKDIDFDNMRMISDTKGKNRKVKRIPTLIKKSLIEFIGTRKGRLFELNAKSNIDKRGHMTDQFRKFRKKNNIDPNFKMYHFRHTRITKAYLILRKTMQKSRAIDELSLITGHTSNAIWKYIRVNDVELPEDYSNLIK